MSTKVLGCDLDGVIFNFNDSYSNLFRAMHGIDFPKESPDYPSEWNWELEKATKHQTNQVWDYINKHASYSFWNNLKPYDGAQDFLYEAQKNFDKIVYITSRPGGLAKMATEDALKSLGMQNPHVVISHNKPPDILEHGVTHFVDDRDKNFDDILAHPNLGDLKMFIYDKPWNRHYNRPEVKRIFNLGALL